MRDTCSHGSGSLVLSNSAKGTSTAKGPELGSACRGAGDNDLAVAASSLSTTPTIVG